MVGKLYEPYDPKKHWGYWKLSSLRSHCEEFKFLFEYSYSEVDLLSFKGLDLLADMISDFLCYLSDNLSVLSNLLAAH